MKKRYNYIFSIIYVLFFFGIVKNVSAASTSCPASALVNDLRDGAYSITTISSKFDHKGVLQLNFVPKQLYVKLSGVGETFGYDRNSTTIQIGQDNNNIVNQHELECIEASLNANSGEYVEVNFYLKDDYVLNYNGKKCTYKKDTKVYKLDAFPTYESNNPLYDNAACVSLRNDYPKRSNCSSRNSLNCYAYQTIPECYEEKANNIVESDISGLSARISSFRKYANAVQSAKDNTSGDDPNSNHLQCDYYSNDKKTVVREKTQETTSIEGCHKTCHEKVTVMFDPPVATESGMCFTYVSEIKSTVECETEFLRPEPKEKSIICYDIPACHHTTGTGDAAGPNENFEHCIMQCDNGKYTQDCIDTCYQKVYEEKNTIQSDYLTYEDSKIQKLAEGPHSSWTSPNCNNLFSDRSLMGLETPTIKVGGDDEDYALIEELVKFKSMYPGGKVKNGVWKASTRDKDCPSNVAPYYFKTAQSARIWINHLRHSFTMKDGIIGSADTSGRVEDKNYTCTSKCSFESCGSNSLSNSDFDAFEAEENWEQWEADRAACLAGNVCKDYVRTGEFTIDVDQNTENGTLTTKYSATHKQDSDQVTNSSVYDEQEGSNERKNFLNLDDNSIVREFSGVCMNGKTIDGESCESNVTSNNLSNNQKLGNETTGCYAYRDLISFPNNYINNKTGQTTNSPDSRIGVTDIGDQFCTRLTSLPVNVDWFDWKVYGDGSLPVGEEKSAIERNTDMNIQIKIKDFGYFGWNFDIDCFYGSIQNPICEEAGTCTCEELGTCPDDTVEPKIPPGEDPPTPNPDVVPVTNDLIFRTIDLDKVFTRSARYNWNCNSTNLENSEYIVQPTALITNIEKKGDSIYTDSKELDYKFHLDVQDILNIKEYNKNNKNFFETAGISTVESDGLSIYKSPFLDEFSSIIQKRGVIGCNNASGNQCTESYQGIVRDACYNEYMAQKGS